MDNSRHGRIPLHCFLKPRGVQVVSDCSEAAARFVQDSLEHKGPGGQENYYDGQQGKQSCEIQRQETLEVSMQGISHYRQR
jgi:hypothetical protein